MRAKSSIWLFLLGLWSATQVHFIGSIGISELPMFVLAPFFFLKDYAFLKQDGFMAFIGLSVLTCIACCVSSLINETPFVFFLKGLAQPYAIFSATVIFHRLLRNNLAGLKWFLIGAFLSGIISIFIFQPEVYTVRGGQIAEGEAAVNAVTSNPLFWSTKIRSLFNLPIWISYMSLPSIYSYSIPVLGAFVSLFFSSGSGRSAAGVSFMSAFLIFLGMKSRKKIAKVGKNMAFIVIGCLLAALLLKGFYSYAATQGLLGSEAQTKYEKQTQMGTSLGRILMAGRMEFFCGILACLDRPLWGFGPKAEDVDGYTERYLAQYASLEDYENFLSHQRDAARIGALRYIEIPTHSYMAMFWVYFGAVGLIFWIYVLIMFYKYFRWYASAIPHWYGFLTLSITAEVWNIFFSPFASRMYIPLIITCILFAKAIREKKVMLPFEMEMEIAKYE